MRHDASVSDPPNPTDALSDLVAQGAHHQSGGRYVTVPTTQAESKDAIRARRAIEANRDTTAGGAALTTIDLLGSTRL
jgi:hypothetical protein